MTEIKPYARTKTPFKWYLIDGERGLSLSCIRIVIGRIEVSTGVGGQIAEFFHCIRTKIDIGRFDTELLTKRLPTYFVVRVFQLGRSSEIASVNDRMAEINNS